VIFSAAVSREAKFFFEISETRNFVFTFVNQIRTDFAEKFNAVVSSDPEIANFVQTLQ
jgi:hypothetical protein